MAGAALFLVGLAAGAPAWSAEENPEHVVRYRQMVLGSRGRHMGATSMVAKGEIPRTGDVVLNGASPRPEINDLNIGTVNLVSVEQRLQLCRA